MSASFSRSESETSQTLLQTCSEIKSIKLNVTEAMHKLASPYSNSRQVSLQEAVYYSLTELWLRKYCPITVFVNTNIPSESIRICKSVEEIEELDPDSTDIFKQNMVDRYIDKPDSRFKSGVYNIVGHICFTMFVAHYYLDYENEDDYDSQPYVLTLIWVGFLGVCFEVCV